MARRLVNGFFRAVLGHPLVTVLVVLVLLVGAGYQARHFELDASAESLLLEDDQDLAYYREVRQRYGSDAFLFVTFDPQAPLFERATLETLDTLRGDLAAIEGVESVTSILDVPLVQAPDVDFDTIQNGAPTLRDEDVSLDQARQEFLTSPLYADLLLSGDAETTAMRVALPANERHNTLLQQRAELRERREGGALDAAGRRELAALERQVDEVGDRDQARLEQTIASIREVLDQYRDQAQIHLGGVPMIAVDMIEFVRSDIATFGVGVAVFIVLLLALAFRRLRWVLVPSAICAATVVAMVGWIGFMRWPVTVVSSNFISLVLIITLSLIVHLIVRYRELQARDAAADQHTLVRQTIRSKFKPSFFTALTTGISFASLMFADIQPVMDFGLMMVCSVVAGFVFTFVLFPALLAPFRPVRTTAQQRRDWAGWINLGVAQVVHRRPGRTGAAFVVLVLLGVIGASQLTVENRFIDYFHEDTEIYQGMSLIDRELGGTTPLDVVLEAPPWFMEEYEDERAFDEEMGIAPEPTPAQGYWYNANQLERVVEIHDYLEGFEATGKVLSVGTAWQMVLQLNDGEPLEPFELGILYNRVPADLRAQLIDPYLTEDGNEIRFDIRVIDSLPGLERDRLLERIRTGIPENFDVQPEQVHLSGMLVLYNNVMQSLVRSQVITMAIVAGAIMLMFGLLYGSLRMALIGPIPTLAASSMVLGGMGWVGLPLDIMTMTIAAIVIGIGVHDTIHYVDRFEIEIGAGADYPRAAEIAHREVGRAMVYTTVIVTLGFSILALSNFTPTIYFGLLTGLAMIVALVSNLALLPVLLEKLRPFGRCGSMAG